MMELQTFFLSQLAASSHLHTSCSELDEFSAKHTNSQFVGITEEHSCFKTSAPH